MKRECRSINAYIHTLCFLLLQIIFHLDNAVVAFAIRIGKCLSDVPVSVTVEPKCTHSLSCSARHRVGSAVLQVDWRRLGEKGLYVMFEIN